MKLSLLLLVFSLSAHGTSAQRFFKFFRNPNQRPTLRPTSDPTRKPTNRPVATLPADATAPPTPQPAELTTAPPTEATSPSPTPPPTDPQPDPLKDHLNLIKSRIRDTMTNDPRIGATYIRLAFHDCVPNGSDGGCDGCINLTSGANDGLQPAVDALAPIVRDLENAGLRVSRADIWMLAALLAAEDAQNTLVFTDTFKVGRKTCETAGTCFNSDKSTCASFGPDVPGDFPSPDFTTHQLIDFMSDHFGYSADDTVAIMGAHTLGRALPGNAGFDGKWVTNEFALNNEYYTQIVGNPVLANAPDWTQITVQSTGATQWIRAAGSPLMMLNVDIGLARDLNGSMTGNRTRCVFRPNANRSCPLADTLAKAGVYRNNNDAWLADFKKVFIVMVEKGLV